MIRGGRSTLGAVVQNQHVRAYVPGQLEQAFHSIDAAERDALQYAADRIRAYAGRQKLESWEYTDADTIKAEMDKVAVRSVLWQPPTLLGEPINTPEDDYEPRLSADGLMIFFVRGKAGTNADIHFSRKTPGGWTEPEPIGEGLRQTYIGFVCGADDTLHLVFRFWRYGAEPHTAS